MAVAHTFRGLAFLAVICLFASGGHGASPETPIPWEEAIHSHFAALLTCAIPPALGPSIAASVPDEFATVLASVSVPLISDGCSVTVFANPANDAVFLEASGGIANHIHLIFGPLPPNPDLL